MIGFERQNQLMELLEKTPGCSVRHLAEQLYTSEATVRRDLCVLENRGLLRRVYGGAVLSRSLGEDAPLVVRNLEHSDVKDGIARRAAEFIRNGDTLLLDASSTTLHLLKYLPSFRDLTVITNSITVVERLADSDVRVFCTGGKFVPQNAVFVGSGAEEALRSMNADLLFFSSQGLSEDGEITDSNEEETAVRRVMLSRAKRKIFLCHSEKRGKRYLFRLATLDDVDETVFG